MNFIVFGLMCLSCLSCPSLSSYVILSLRPRVSNLPDGGLEKVDDFGLLFEERCMLSEVEEQFSGKVYDL